MISNSAAVEDKYLKFEEDTLHFAILTEFEIGLYREQRQLFIG